MRYEERHRGSLQLLDLSGCECVMCQRERERERDEYWKWERSDRGWGHEKMGTGAQHNR
jgi:hypothetical protein